MGRGVKEDEWECEKGRWRDGKEGEDGRREDMIVKVQGRGLDRDECKA